MINRINDIKIGDLVIIETVIDKYVGWVSEKDYQNKCIWISQAKSNVAPIYFNFYEIISIKKI